MVTEPARRGHDEEFGINQGNRLDANPRPVQWSIHFVLLALTLITLLPMVNVFAISLSSADAFGKHPMMLIPHELTLDAYKYIVATPILTRSFSITVFVTVCGTTLNLVFTLLAAYGLSKTYIPGHKLLMWWVIVPMLFSAGLIPQYLLYKNLGITNTLWVLILPGLVSPFNLILLRNFFWSIPGELEESARMDGASDWGILTRIVLPLSKPVLATVGLFYAVGHWNDYFKGLFFINKSSLWPLQVVLRSIIVDLNSMGELKGDDLLKMVVQPENIKAATIVFAMIPMLLVYPFLQKYFVKGILLGSVKG